MLECYRHRASSSRDHIIVARDLHLLLLLLLFHVDLIDVMRWLLDYYSDGLTAPQQW